MLLVGRVGVGMLHGRLRANASFMFIWDRNLMCLFRRLVSRVITVRLTLVFLASWVRVRGGSRMKWANMCLWLVVGTLILALVISIWKWLLVLARAILTDFEGAHPIVPVSRPSSTCLHTLRLSWVGCGRDVTLACRCNLVRLTTGVKVL